MSPQVLVVSRDAMLLHTRQLILGAFFRTLGAGRLRDAEALMSTNRFHLIILCYTVDESDCRRITELAMEQKQPPRILILTPAGTAPVDSGADQSMMESGPYYLLKKSAELLGVDIRAKANMVEA